MKRYAQVIKVKKDKIELYKKLHQNVWPEILELISECNIKNYSIFLKDDYLFSYFEYVGQNYEKDMEKMANNPINKKWWAECMPCHKPLDTRKEGEWWAEMTELFYLK